LINRLLRQARACGWHLSLMGLLLCLLWASIVVDLWHERRDAEQEAFHDTANLAHVFEEDITRTIEGVDQALTFLRVAHQHGTPGSSLERWASMRPLFGNMQVQLGMSDRNGKVVWSNLTSEPTSVTIADREHFLAQKDTPEDRLFISRPVVGRISHTRTIQFTRKLFAPDGSFDGIAIVSLDPRYLSRFYQSISIESGSILLTTTAGVVLARSPDNETLPETLPDYAIERILRGAETGGFRGRSSIDQTERIFHSRRLPNYPLVVVVGLATKDVFAASVHDERIYTAVGIALSAAIIAVGLLMIRQRNSLLASRQGLALTLEHMSQGIAMIDKDSNVQVFNQRALDLLGLPRTLLDGKMSGAEIVRWQMQQGEFGEEKAWDPNLKPLLEGTASVVGDYTYERVRPNGEVLEIRTQRADNGGIVRTYTDVTVRKRHEAELAAAQVRAAQAERMQVLGRLAGGIAHDFNNILQAVRGSINLIGKRADDPDSIRRFARMISDVTERGASITRRLLAFARRGELRAEPVDAAALLRGLCEVLGHTLGEKVSVETRLAPDLPPLLADRGQLETVIVNLATNARDAMPEGGVVTLSAQPEVVTAAEGGNVPAGQYIHLSIGDTGSGMDEATLARALEPFFSTKPLGQGTGLGLSMAKAFVEQSGGVLTITTAPNRGTTVHLWLPATAQSGPVTPPSTVALSGEAIAREETGKRILLVDDEAMIRETLAASLEDAGYAVLIAEGGAMALDILRSAERIDVLVTDLSMPLVDGLAVIEQARTLRPQLPAILLTGYAGHGAQLTVGASISGRFTLLRKPVTEAQLIDRIEAALSVKVDE
jgi:signal transduction histidine kinase/ActR/RegA family two-component response regulator